MFEIVLQGPFKHMYMYVYIHVHVYTSKFMIRFEARAKLAQQWLVYASLEIHLEPINKKLMLLVTI